MSMSRVSWARLSSPYSACIGLSTYHARLSNEHFEIGHYQRIRVKPPVSARNGPNMYHVGAGVAHPAEAPETPQPKQLVRTVRIWHSEN